MSIPRLSALIAALIFLAWAWQAGWPGEISAADVGQNRLDTAIPPLTPEVELRRPFRPQRPGLHEIELLIARWESGAETVGAQVVLQLWQGERLIAEERFASGGLRHNQPLVFRFAPEWESAGELYELRIAATAPTAVSFWGYSLASYADGRLSGASGDAQDLRFDTRYRLSWPTAGLILADMLRRDGAALLLALAFITLPGALFMSFYGRRWPVKLDNAAWWGTAVALGLSIWPLLWFWFSLFGGRWTGWLLWALFIGGWIIFLYRIWLRPVADRAAQLARSGDWPEPEARIGIRGYGAGQDGRVQALLLLLLLAGLGVRLLAVRDLAFPAWVDSGRHGLITAVMVDNGRFLNDYEPYLPVTRAPYHFGFHTLSASLVMMTGADMPRLILLLGQLLNALVPLALYTGVWQMTRRPWAGLFAAFLVALPFLFPGYYATWGRMTQLTGMIVLPVLLASSWALSQHGRWRPLWPLVALLTAGLFLIHFRLFLIYLPFLGLILLLSGRPMFTRRGWAAARRSPFVILGLTNGLAALLIAPRLGQLFLLTQPTQRGLARSPAGYNSFPTGYLTAGWETYFAAAAGLALILVVGAALRGRRWSAFPLTLLVWVGLLFVLLMGNQLGLPELWLINMNSMYIALFAPLAMLLALVVYQGQRWLRRRGRVWQALGAAGMSLFIAAAALFGLREQIAILNAQTILARSADQAGLAWLDDNLPADAVVAVQSWRWLGQTWSATDGGVWITPITGRLTSTPPADYVYNPDLFWATSAFNEAATARDNWDDPAAAVWLQAQGMTHIYIGARGGFFDPAVLLRNPGLNLLYQHDGVFIFAIAPSNETAD